MGVQTYSIDMTDEAARSLIRELREGLGGGPANHIADILEAQIPRPVPVKIGAVVQTDQGQFLRWTYDAHSGEPWIAINDVDTTYRTDQIGRITEVLSEGVDL